LRNNDGDEAHTLHGKIAEKNTRLVVSNEAGVFNLELQVQPVLLDSPQNIDSEVCGLIMCVRPVDSTSAR
jgi:hypothetical protein